MRDSGEDPPSAVLVMGTLGAPERRLWRGRRGRDLEFADPEPVPTTRVTVVRPEAFASRADADEWLSGMRSSGGDEELDRALAVLNGALRAWRSAAADPYSGDVTTERGPGGAHRLRGRRVGGRRPLRRGLGATGLRRPRGCVARWSRRRSATPRSSAAASGASRARSWCCARAWTSTPAGCARPRSRRGWPWRRCSWSCPRRRGAEPRGDRGVIGDAANQALAGEVRPDVAAGLAEAIARMELAVKRLRMGH